MDVFMKDQHDGVSSETNLQAIDFHGYGDCGHVELKEQDLIKQLEEKRSNNGDSGSVLDCTLTLGPSGLRQRQMDCSNHARNEESLYVPTDCHSSSPQATTGIGSSSWNGYAGGLPTTSDFFAAYANSLVVDANGCMTPTDFHVIPKYVPKNRPESSFFQSKENAGDAGKEGITTVRKCFFCQTTSTPLWRNGPKGSKSLCNACGIRYKKEERKALAAAAAAPVGSRSDIDGGGEDDNRAQQSARK